MPFAAFALMRALAFALARALAGALALAATLAACAEPSAPTTAPPPPGPPTTAVLTGRTLRAEDGVAYGPLRIVLLNVETLSIDAITRSDGAGAFRFGDLAPGRYMPVVYDFERTLFHLPQTRLAVDAAESLDVSLPLAPLAADQGIALEGLVVDSRTGRPVAGAMVDLGSVAGAVAPYLSNRVGLFSELSGQSGGLDQITDENGEFRLWPVYFLPNPDPTTWPNGSITPDLLVSHPGYRGYRRRGFTPENIPNYDDIALEPGADSSAVTGRVVDLAGHPVAGLRVGLEWTRGELPRYGAGQPAAGKPGLPGPGGATLVSGPGVKTAPGGPLATPTVILQGAVGVTGSDGRFRIDGVPQGHFKIMPGYLPDDGWVGDFGDRSANVETAASGEVDAGDVPVVPAIAALSPADGDTIRGPLTLSWAAAAGASEYWLLIEPLGREAVHRGPLYATSLTPTRTSLLQPGLYRWQVSAMDARGEIARVERSRMYVVPR